MLFLVTDTSGRQASRSYYPRLKIAAQAPKLETVSTDQRPGRGLHRGFFCFPLLGERPGFRFANGRPVR